eukprot:Opistho-1_new@106983
MPDDSDDDSGPERVACLTCRVRHRKCDGRTPCSTCAKLSGGRASKCTYPSHKRRGRRASSAGSATPVYPVGDKPKPRMDAQRAAAVAKHISAEMGLSHVTSGDVKVTALRKGAGAAGRHGASAGAIGSTLARVVGEPGSWTEKPAPVALLDNSRDSTATPTWEPILSASASSGGSSAVAPLWTADHVSSDGPLRLTPTGLQRQAQPSGSSFLSSYPANTVPTVAVPLALQYGGSLVAANSVSSGVAAASPTGYMPPREVPAMLAAAIVAPFDGLPQTPEAAPLQRATSQRLARLDALRTFGFEHQEDERKDEDD